MVRKIQMLGLTLIVMFTFVVVFAVMASAETTLEALWLVGGAAVEANLASEINGEITWEDTKVPIIGNAGILCSFIFDGTFGAGGVGLIESVLSLMLELTSSVPLEGLALLCVRVLGCEEATEASPIEVWFENLPWPTLLFLTEGGLILDLVEKSGYDLLCLVLGTMQEDLCEAADYTFEVMNEPTAEILGGETELPLSTCTIGGAETGANITDVLMPITVVAGGELTVSSE